MEVGDLWRRHNASGDERARELLVFAYSPLVQYVYERLAPRSPAHVEDTDLISYGFVGLASAIESFKPGKLKFETYARPRIKRAIIDELGPLD